MRRVPRSLLLAYLLTAFIAISGFGGCGADNEVYIKFGQAGQVYAEAMGLLTTYAIDTSIEASSERILSVDGKENIALKDYRDFDTVSQNRVAQLAAFQKHVGLMNQYFTEILRLAQTNAPASASTAAGEIVKQLNAVSASAGGTAIFGESVQTAAGKLAELAIRAKVSRALRRHLVEYSKTVRAHLALQEKGLDTIAEMVSDNVDSINNNVAVDQVDLPIRATAPLTGKAREEWKAARRKMMLGGLKVEHVQATKEALKKLHAALDDAIEARLSRGQLESAIASFAAIVPVFKSLVQQPEGSK